LLQAELSQKEWALEEKQAAARGLEVKYRQEIETLRRQLAKRDLSISPHAGEFGGEPRLNLVQREPSAATQSAESRAGKASPQENRRRWRSALSRKRRWR